MFTSLAQVCKASLELETGMRQTDRQTTGRVAKLQSTLEPPDGGTVYKSVIVRGYIVGRSVRAVNNAISRYIMQSTFSVL